MKATLLTVMALIAVSASVEKPSATPSAAQQQAAIISMARTAYALLRQRQYTTKRTACDECPHEGRKEREEGIELLILVSCLRDPPKEHRVPHHQTARSCRQASRLHQGYRLHAAESLGVCMGWI